MRSAVLISSSFSIFVVEEPDEEPKVYPQQDNAKSTPSPLRESIQFDKQASSPRSPMVSSTSTVHAHRRRRNKTKYRRQNNDTPPQHHPREQFNQKSRIFHAPSYSRYYEPAPPRQPTPPPRFQQRFPMKENDFRVRTDFSMPSNMSHQWVSDRSRVCTASTSLVPSSDSIQTGPGIRSTIGLGSSYRR